MSPVVAAARQWLGTPYQHQASIIGIGCDCLGLVRGVWRALMGPEPQSVPAYSPDWAEASAVETLLGAAQLYLQPVDGPICAGQVLAFRWRDHLPVKHLGIATSAHEMIHAHDGACVCEVPLHRAWRAKLVAQFIFPVKD